MIVKSKKPFFNHEKGFLAYSAQYQLRLRNQKLHRLYKFLHHRLKHSLN